MTEQWNAMAVLAERGINVPDGIDVNVVENSDNTVHITMPTAPSGAMDLSDEELAGAAGGGVEWHSAFHCPSKMYKDWHC